MIEGAFNELSDPLDSKSDDGDEEKDLPEKKQKNDIFLRCIKSKLNLVIKNG